MIPYYFLTIILKPPFPVFLFELTIFSLNSSVSENFGICAYLLNIFICALRIGYHAVVSPLLPVLSLGVDYCMTVR